MTEAMITRYWCHMCRRIVNPVIEMELKCPFCDTGFVQEMDGRDLSETEETGSEGGLSPWASILLGMMATPAHRRRPRIPRTGDDDDSSDVDHELETGLRRRRREFEEDRGFREGEDEVSDTEHEPESIVRRRRRRTAILQLLQSLREDFRSESDELERERAGERERESVVLINSFNHAIVLQGSLDSDHNETQEPDFSAFGATMGDYFIGSGLDLLLQHLAENDPNRYGTPPAQKEAVDGLPTVQIYESMSCPVCLEDCEIGMEAKEMPCKHKFHTGCILPWLELHSSCPVCRFQLPGDETKTSGRAEGGVEGSFRGRSSRARASPWRFSGLFPLPGSQSDENSSSNPASSSSAFDHNSAADES